MNAIFADTSYFVALLDRDDDFHAAASAFSAGMPRPMLVTSAIIQELGAAFSGVAYRGLLRVVLEIVRAAEAEMVHVDATLQQRAIELFEKRRDKQWSLADCISFLVMRDRGVYEAATTDHHFEEAGFIALLRNPVQ